MIIDDISNFSSLQSTNAIDDSILYRLKEKSTYYHLNIIIENCYHHQMIQKYTFHKIENCQHIQINV